MVESGPNSPCLNICSLDEHGICRGCFRTITEIAGWTRMDPPEQRAVIEKAQRRRHAGHNERSER